MKTLFDENGAWADGESQEILKLPADFPDSAMPNDTDIENEKVERKDPFESERKRISELQKKLVDQKLSNKAAKKHNNL